jgi:glycosyltransferase involved in cell wall biosynthesis
MPRISIVVPVYNAENFLTRSVGSIQRQSLADIEIILVDDGSQDGSLALMKKLAGSDPRIHLFHKENGGASTARNLGVRQASGELIGFVDADDYIEPDMYETMLQAYDEGIGQTGTFLVQIGREEVDEAANQLPFDLPVPKERKLVSPEPFIESLLLYTGDASFCTKLTPKKLLLRYPFPEGVMGEDFLLHMQILPKIAGVLLLPKLGYHVVHRSGSVTRRADAKQFSRSYIDIVKHADYVEQTIVPEFPALRKQACRFGLYERLDYLLHVPIPDMNAENSFYRDVCRYLRAHFGQMLCSPYLTAKNKLYLTILTAAPKFVRQVHWILRAPQS